MAIDAVTRAEDTALLLDPFLVGVADAGLDAVVADRLEGACEMMGVLLPQCPDGLAAALVIRFVPDIDVAVDEQIDVGHGLLLGDVRPGHGSCESFRR